MMRTNMGSFPFVVSSVSMDLGSVNAPPPLEHRDSGVAGPVLHKNGRSSLLVVKDRLLRAGSKKASPEWKKIKKATSHKPQACSLE